MEESLSEDSIQEMLEELEEEQQSSQEPLSPDVEELVRELESGRYSYTRSKAAEQLGRVDTSSPRIVQALLTACETDAHSLVREAAAKALSAPVHQEWLQNHPRLLRVAEGILQREAAEAAEFALRWQHAERCDRTKPTNSNLVVVSISGGIILLGIGIAGLSGIISRFSPALVFALILAGVVLVACALWTWLAPSSARNVFLRSMKETVGTVEDLRKKVNYEDHTYYVTVRFKADDANMGTRVLALEAEVARRIWKGMKHGNTIGIQYAAEDPRIALIRGEW